MIAGDDQDVGPELDDLRKAGVEFLDPLDLAPEIAILAGCIGIEGNCLWGFP